MKNEVNRALVAKKNINLKTNMTMRRINLNLFRYAAMLLCVLTLGVGQAWAGGGGSTYYYAKVTLSTAGPTGAGSVYASTSTTQGSSNAVGATKSAADTKSVAFYGVAKPNSGYRFVNWTNTANCSFDDANKASNVKITVSTSQTSEGSATEGKATANFEAIKVTAAPADVNINATDPSATYPDAAGVVVGFTTSSSNANSDFTTGGSGDSRWTISSWPTHASATSTTFNYKFVGNGSYGTNNRTFTKTVTLKGLNDATVKTCTLTAKYPNPRVVECNEGSTDLTIYPTFSAADATQAAVEKTAVFDVVYADNANNFSAAFSGATGSGTWTVTGITVDQANQRATVNYTFNGNKSAGTHTAVLTLTANNCQGWDDTSADGGASATVTLTAENMQEATDDAKVIAKNGTTLIYQGDWATAWTRANTAANAGCTLYLLRNVGGLTAYQEVKNTFTLDLNGKILSGKRNGTLIYLNPTGKTLTVKDSKTGGAIQHIHNEYSGTPVCVNLTKGSLILESGTLYCENKGASGRKAGGVICKAGTTFTMNGGKIDVWGYNGAYGVNQESDKNDNTTFTMNNGEIVALGYSDIYGVQAAGKVDIKEGTTISATATYSNCRGITLSAAASATAANCYYGQLTMNGGTINSSCTANADGDRLAYGIYFACANTGMGTAVATDGSHANKAASTGTIENATITVSTLGRKAYGVWVEGSYQSKTNNYDVIKIKNTTINATSQYYYTYGVYAQVGVNSTHGACTFGNIELTDCNVSATTTKNHTAYAVYGAATYATVFKDKQPNYYGEYAVASKITINRGTYIAETGTYNAYAVVTGTRARSMYDPETSVYADRKLGGAATAYPELTINDGTFTATAKGTNSDRPARAVSSGGNTTITGGTFKAVSNGRYARAIYGVTGKLKVTGATIEAVANGKYASDNTTSEATGVFADATIQTPTGFTDYCDAEITNCDITATTKVGTGAYGVYINCTSRPFTELYLRLDSINNSWTHKDDGSGTYDIYKYIYPSGDRSVAAKCKVSGGKIKAESQTVGSAYGIYAAGPTMSHYGTTSAECQLIVEKGTDINVQANTSTACAIQTAGLSTIDNVTAVAKTVTSTSAYGVYCNYNKTTITNSSFTVTGATGTAYGVYANASLGSNSSATTKKIPSSATTATTIIPAYNYAFVKEAEIELGEGNVFDVKTTSGNTAYAVYVHAAKADWTKAETYLNATGSYAYAAKATITGGTYKANAAGTTSYALCLAAKQTQGSATAQPELEVTGGKFKGYAAGGTSGDINANGVTGSCVLKGGVYTYNTNLSKYIPEGYEEVPLASDRTEYGEGYRYEVDKAGMHGIDVCQIGSTKYKSLEEALQVVTSGQVIYMIANYTMATPGDYVLPANTTLLIPYKTGSGKGASTAIGNSASTTTSATTPSLFRKLTFGNGVNLICYGTIETSAQQKANGQYSACVGMPSGPYGQIQMDEGSHISMESGSRLNCWGYITGKGTINVKNNATVLEGFQLGDWCGGTNATTLTGSSNKGKAFPITHYFYQSIECPITYRPGAKALGSTHVNMSFVGTVGQDAVPLVGTSDAMFIMDNVNASEDTWVMKDYDEETDYCYWTINSGASIGNLIVKIPDAIDVNSADYILPICSNMAVVLNYGEGYFGQHAVFTPGSKLIINKEGTLVLKNVNVSVLDLTEYTGATIYRATYSPTWGTTNPRSTSVNDAEVFVHGKVELKNNGGLYTSASGANIHSTNSDAGQVLYTSAAQSDKTTYYLKNAATSATAVTVNAAKLRNEDNTYSSTGGTATGDVWVYVNSKWTKKTKEGCFSVETTDKKHYFIQPSDVVEVNYPAQSNHTYTSVTGNRVFVWDEDCYWWEVETDPTPEGYYKAITPDHNGKYNYYYYDSSANCWKIKTITVTWNINGSNTNYSVGYGTKPEWLGATPTKTSTSSNYVWRWDGWTQGSSTEVLANNDLPYVTENTTFTAHFYEKYYEYNVIFKNSDGTILDSRNWIAGTTPSYEGTPTKNPTAAETYEFNGTWSPAITKVTGSATYTAQYTATPRAYTITFLNYDMSKLGTAQVVYNGTPSNATYLAAVAPVTEDPYKPDNSAFSFEFAGWKLQGASSNGFAQVKGDQTYVAQFNQTTKKYKVSFVDDDGETVLHYLQLEYGATPSYTWANPANKQDAEWTYSFASWDPAEFATVEGPQTYTATYNKTHREYPITWIDGNGNTLTTTNVEYGTTPTYPGTLTPTKTPTNTINYTFNNTWSPALAPVTGEATYMAQFNESERTYALTISVNEAGYGSVNQTSVTGIPYNASVTVNGNSITVNGTTVTATPHVKTAQYTYMFDHWENWPNTVTTDVANIQAVFARTVNKYHITWQVKLNGEILESKEEDVEYGTTPSYGSTPTKEQNQSQVFTFSGWEPEPYAVEKDEKYTGSFNVSPRPYTITFVNDNGVELWHSDFGYGSTPSYGGSTPVSSHTGDGYTYTHAGWKPALAQVNGTATYTAKYDRSAEAITVSTQETVTDNTIASTTTVENHGALTIEEAELQSTTIIVESGGQLNVEESGSINADVFIIQATTEDQEVTPGAHEEVQVSGELSETGSKNLSAIYYDLTRKHGTEKFLARVWYAVAVPWAVEVSMNTNEGGVYIKRGDEYVKQRLGTSYDLLCYDGDCRAQNGAGANCWVYLEDEIVAGTADAVMVPGKLYMIYLTEETSTIRFKKKVCETCPIHTNSLEVTPYSAENGNDANWNGIANPATYRANMNVIASGLVQKFVPGTQPREPGRYMTLNLSDPQAVGQPFFVQVANTETTVIKVSRPANPSTAPRRMKDDNEQEARYAIGIAANGKLADRLYIQTAEEKEDKYVIGQDMSKMGISNYVAQMWVARYDSKLCLNTVAMARDKAVYPLGIYAPQAGEYMIFAPAEIASGDNIYLTLDGRVIWNLTYSPYYASLEQGTTTRYGLRIVRDNTSGGTTGVDEVHSGDIQCEKVIMDDHVYILRGEELYTVTGQKAK